MTFRVSDSSMKEFWDIGVFDFVEPPPPGEDRTDESRWCFTLTAEGLDDFCEYWEAEPVFGLTCTPPWVWARWNRKRRKMEEEDEILAVR